MIDKSVIYKGYIETNGKVPIKKYKDIKNYEEYGLETVSSAQSYAGIIGEEYMILDFDDERDAEIALKIILGEELKTLVYKTTRGIHAVFKTPQHISTFTNNQLCVGLKADIKIGSANGIEILKYNGIEREIILDTDEIEELPYYFLNNGYTGENKEFADFKNMESGSGRNQMLFNYILVLHKRLHKNVDFIKNTIILLNKYVLKEKLSDSELSSILREDSFTEIKNDYFGKRGIFHHNIFGDDLIQKHNIKVIDNVLHVYSDGIYKSGYKAIEKQMLEEINNLTSSRRTEVLKYIEVKLDGTEVDRCKDDFKIAFKNGIYDIISKKMIPSSPEYIITNKINFDYIEDAYDETMDKTLNKIACNSKEIRDLFDEIIGYCFLRKNELGKSFVLTGNQSNGKSTFIKVLQHLLGRENTASLQLEELNQRFVSAELHNKLANLGDDIGDDFLADTATFKKLVTGDTMFVERKGERPFEMKFYGKLIFCANSMPRMKDKTGAIFRRLVMIPFEQTFSVNDPDYDPYIIDKLRTDNAMSYLINCGLRGLDRVLRNHKFTECEKVKKALIDYDKENNPIKVFFEDELSEDEVIDCPTQDVYNKYIAFCNNENLKPMGKNGFSKQVLLHYGVESKVAKIDGFSCRIFSRR